jgi:hypothetical protein
LNVLLAARDGAVRKAKHLEGLMIEPVDPILFAPVICDFD